MLRSVSILLCVILYIIGFILLIPAVIFMGVIEVFQTTIDKLDEKYIKKGGKDGSNLEF